MSTTFYRIVFFSTLLILILSAVALMIFRPAPSDEEIPRGSKRVYYHMENDFC